jgi:ATP-binding cassette subfamily B protein
MRFGGGGGGWGAHMAADERKPSRPAGPTLKRAVGLFAAHWPLVSLLALAITAASLIGLIPPLLIRAIIDDAIKNHNGAQANLLVLGIIVATLGGSLVGVAQSWLSNIVGQGVMEDVRNRLYACLQKMPLRFFTTTRGGEILSRFSNDVNAIQDGVTNTFSSLLSNVITVVSTVILMSILDWRLTLLGLAALPLFIWPTRRAAAAQRRLQQRQQERMADMSAHTQETLSINGILLTKLFGQEAYEMDRFRGMNHDVRDLSIRRAMIGRWFFMFLGLFGALAPALVYWYGAHAVINGDMDVGTVVAMAAFLTRLFGPVTQLFSTHVTVQSNMALFERIFDYLDLKSEIEERPNAVELPRAEGRVEFDHVSFAYTKHRLALNDVSFAVEPGQIAALVGPSGAGKTTISYLIPRLFDVTEGAVRIDGIDVRDLTLSGLAANIGMVTQEPFIFHASLRENIAYARPGATDDDIMRVMDAANLTELLARMPKRLDTVVGERGYRLSGGERQRIAIARVLLKDPPVLVLDEATNSLDSESEYAVQSAVAKLLAGRTTIVIAHRLSTIHSADQILVLEDGKLVERGKHDELLSLGGLYARLYQRQFASERVPSSVSEAENG